MPRMHQKGGHCREYRLSSFITFELQKVLTDKQRHLTPSPFLFAHVKSPLSLSPLSLSISGFSPSLVHSFKVKVIQEN